MIIKVKQIAKEFKAKLKVLYGDDLSDLILFGSYARGDFNNDSDIDFAVVLKSDNTNTPNEISKLSVITSDFLIKFSELVSVFPISSNKYKNSNLPIYQENRKDGIKI
jgi:uncharacterized protein